MENDLTISKIIYDVFLVTVGGGIILASIIWLFKKIFSKKTPPVPTDNAVYLSETKESTDSMFLGRDKLMKTAVEMIKGDESCPFVGNKIAIIGTEGVGKTLFCQKLFSEQLSISKIYLGWLECNGSQSLFEIIKETFTDSRFHNKNKDSILEAFKNLGIPCVLFIDHVDQYTPMDDLECLTLQNKITVIVSGRLQKIDFIDVSCYIEIPPLSRYDIKKIFEWKSNGELIYMNYDDKSTIELILSDYVRGNPFLAVALAQAKSPDNSWQDLLKHLREREYEQDEHYLKAILRRLYRIDKLDNIYKASLSKLSLFPHPEFVKAIFDWYSIDINYIHYLCKTYWLTYNEDTDLYIMDATHRDVLCKVLPFQGRLEETIHSICIYMNKFEYMDNGGFTDFSIYLEEILHMVKGYAPQFIKDNEGFAIFTYNVADKYHFIVEDYERTLYWLSYCNPSDSILIYMKAVLEFQTKISLLYQPFTSDDIEQAYSAAVETAKELEDFKELESYLMEEYCCFLNHNEEYDEVLSICQEYFHIHGFALASTNECDMFYRYVCAANDSDNKEILELLINDLNISALLKNQDFSITTGWSLFEISEVYEKWGDEDSSENCIKNYILIEHKHSSFFNKSLKSRLGISDLEFATYMHSDKELETSLHEAVALEDADALYIEGRYQENEGIEANKKGDFDQAYKFFNEAFKLYKRAHAQNSLRGTCSLAYMYYKGYGTDKNFDMAREYWEDYCIKRGHRGSFYWLGVLLLDKDYNRYDEVRGLSLLETAAQNGSRLAKEKLEEIKKVPTP